jgi:hypothetical protein
MKYELYSPSSMKTKLFVNQWRTLGGRPEEGNFRPIISENLWIMPE